MTRAILAILALLFLGAPAVSAAEAATPAERMPRHLRVLLANLRTCDEVCQSFRDYLTRQGLDIEFIDRSADGDATRIPDMVREARELRPDLIATWGTVMTLGFVGPYDAVDPATHITDIPVVYLYVADPVGAKIARSETASGRPNVAGANIVVPYENQLRALRAYIPSAQRVGVVFGTDERNSVVEMVRLRAAAKTVGIDLIEETLDLGPDGKPQVERIPDALDRLVKRDVKAIYHISSTFLRLNAEAFCEAAIARNLAVFTYAEDPVRKSSALFSLLNSLRSDGQVVAYQAEQILRHGKAPADLPTPTLTRYTVIINMKTAQRLDLYPPMLMVKYAELVLPEGN